ncbi:MAG: HEAT repeat domain-containing protein [Planctomycetota bacterium]
MRKRMFLWAMLSVLLLVCVAMKSAQVVVVNDEENVVASRLEGVWQPHARLTRRLLGHEYRPGRDPSRGTLSFVNDPSVGESIPAKYDDFLRNRTIYMAGIMKRRGQDHPFILIELHGNPHIVYFTERDGDPMGDAESFNVMLAPGKDPADDLFFVGGDFNNQPFSAYERIKEKRADNDKQNDRLQDAQRPAVRAGVNTCTVNGWPIEVSLIPEKRQIMIGEPIYLLFKVHNRSGRDLQLIEGGDYRNRLGRPESYSITTIREDGKSVPNPDAGQSMGGVRGPQKIPSEGSYVRKLFLPNWARFEEPGKYLITCKRTLNISEHAPDKWNEEEKTFDVDVEVDAKINVVLPDEEKMGKVIAALNDDRALAYINDERVIGHFIEALDNGNSERKYIALRALSKFNDDLALEGLKKGATTTGNDIANTTAYELACQVADNVRHTAAVALSKSKHPQALPFLLSMRSDRSESVRITIVHVLGKMDFAESLAMLQEMAQGNSQKVSGEAKRYLKIRAAETKGNEHPYVK